MTSSFVSSKAPYWSDLFPAYYFEVDGEVYGPISKESEAKALFEQVLETVDRMAGNQLAANER